MRVLNRVSKIFISASAVVFTFAIAMLTAFADSVSVQSQAASPDTSGGENTISILIGIALLTIGTVGFIILKLRERAKARE